MPVSVKLGLKQTQRLTLTQSLKQSIELLQLSTIELSQRISEELVENPVLEEDTVSVLPSISSDESEFINEISRRLSGERDDYRAEEEERIDYSEIPESGFSGNWDDDKKKNLIENAVAQGETLKEHLLWQARITAGNEKELGYYEYIITSIDDSGFLTIRHEEIAEHLKIPLSKVSQIVAQINSFDPIGCGVCTIRESLLIQAAHFHPDDRLLRAILEEHFVELEKLNYEKIARALNASPEEIIARSRIIQNLDPFPGRQYSSRETRYITPDIEVKYIDGEIIISLNDDWIPTIRINSYYINLLQKKSIEKNLREYIQDKVQSARYLMKNISSRRETILKVVRAIMEHQVEFLAKGPGHLKPLVHTDIARELGLHESTISRVASNKFIQTGWGVFEMKYFFVSRIRSENEEDRSSDEVMNLIKDIVAQEKPDKPYSDEEIVAILKKTGIDVARRTIAKYRGMLGIPPSNKRKKLNMIKTKGSL